MKRYNYDLIDSTNEEAKRKIIAGETGDFLLVAKEQSKGKGRKGREFFSPKDTGIYMTYVHTGKESVEETLKITSATAVIVRNAIAKVYNKECGIKWVNDLYLDGRKICGILCECVLKANEREENGYIVGIGINIGTNEFPEEICQKAGSLGVSLIDEKKEKLMDLIVYELSCFFNDPNQYEFIDDYRYYSICIGKDVELSDGKGIVKKGRVIDISDGGHLLIEDKEGLIDEFSTGEISLLLV